MIRYDRLWATMEACGMTQYRLIKQHNFSAGQIGRLKKNMHVSTHTLDTLCTILSCGIGDIIEFIPEGASIQADSPGGFGFGPVTFSAAGPVAGTSAGPAGDFITGSDAGPNASGMDATEANSASKDTPAAAKPKKSDSPKADKPKKAGKSKKGDKKSSKDGKKGKDGKKNK